MMSVFDMREDQSFCALVFVLVGHGERDVLLTSLGQYLVYGVIEILMRLVDENANGGMGTGDGGALLNAL